MKCSQSSIHWAQTERQTSNTRGTISKNLKETELRYTQTGRLREAHTHTQEEWRQVEVISIDQSIEVEGKEQRQEEKGNFQLKSMDEYHHCTRAYCQHLHDPALDTETEVISNNGSAAAATSCNLSLRRSLLLPPVDRSPDPAPAIWALYI